MKSIFPLIVLALFVTSCMDPNAESAAPDLPMEVAAAPVDALDRGILAHGGLDTWNSFQALSYDIDKGSRQEHHFIDLKTRRTLHSGDGYKVGYDGKDVWVEPNLDAFSGNPAFYNGLDFYFFGIPFLLADPGTIREDLGTVTINGEPYEAVKVAYEDGVGASPDDYYIAHFDPESHQLRYILYTVTFRSQEPNENYNAREYSGWQDVEGLLLPTTMTSYRWNAEERTLGEKRGASTLSNIQLSTAPPDDVVFEKPEVAEIAQ